MKSAGVVTIQIPCKSIIENDADADRNHAAKYSAAHAVYVYFMRNLKTNMDKYIAKVTK